jgi:hypothetical protein
MKKLFATTTLTLLVLLFNLSHAQQVQHKAIKKKEIQSYIAIDQPVMSNYNGSFQFLVAPGIDVIDATFNENIIVTTKSINHLFSKDFLAFVEENRDPNITQTKTINSNLKVIILPKSSDQPSFKTPFISKN